MRKRSSGRWAGCSIAKAAPSWRGGVEPLEELLYKGHVRALLGRLEQEMKGVSPRGPGTKEKRGVLKKVIAYLEARVKLMDYGRLRKEDLVIATGVVEGAARYVVGERLDN